MCDSQQAAFGHALRESGGTGTGKEASSAPNGSKGLVIGLTLENPDQAQGHQHCCRISYC